METYGMGSCSISGHLAQRRLKPQSEHFQLLMGKTAPAWIDRRGRRLRLGGLEVHDGDLLVVRLDKVNDDRDGRQIPFKLDQEAFLDGEHATGTGLLVKNSKHPARKIFKSLLTFPLFELQGRLVVDRPCLVEGFLKFLELHLAALQARLIETFGRPVKRRAESEARADKLRLVAAAQVVLQGTIAPGANLTVRNMG